MTDATKVSGLITTAIINIVIEFVFFLLYSVFRKQPANANIFFARHVLTDKNKTKKGEGFVLENFLPSAGWVKKAYQTSEEEIVKSAGLDSLVYIRTYVFCLRFFGICTILGLFVLLPVNYIYGTVDIDTIGSDALDKFTISNVADGSNRLWVHFSLLYVISFLAYVLLYLEYHNITTKRIEYLYSAPPEPQQFTVLVRAIPKSAELSYSQHVEEFFRKYHPDTYLLQTIAYTNGHGEILQNELRRLSNEVQFLKSLNPKFDKKEYGLLEYYQSRKEALINEIKEYRVKFRQTKKEIPVSFVSFKTRWGAAVAAQTVQTPNPLKWITEWAPEPRDVNWRSLRIRYSWLWITRIVVGIIFVLITVIYFIPAGLVYTLATLDNLKLWFPFAQTILSIPVVGTLVNGYLPSLLISILYYFIPPVMMFLTQFEGYPSLSGQERMTCGKVYLFVVSNSFFLVTYGTLINLLTQAIENPRQIPALLASAVASQVNFFMNFVMTKGWTGYAIEILQPALLLTGFLQRHIVRRRQYGPHIISLQYYRALPTTLLFIFIGFIYVVIAPLMLPFLMIYFALGYIVYRNQIINMYEPEYETGGQHWPHIHNRVIFSVFMMQVICIGMFGVKRLAMASTLSVPLLLLTLLFHYYCKLRFYPVFQDTSVQISLTKDNEDATRGLYPEIYRKLETAYLNPALQPVEADNNNESSSHEPLLHGESSGV